MHQIIHILTGTKLQVQSYTQKDLICKIISSSFIKKGSRVKVSKKLLHNYIIDE